MRGSSGIADPRPTRGVNHRECNEASESVELATWTSELCGKRHEGLPMKGVAEFILDAPVWRKRV